MRMLSYAKNYFRNCRVARMSNGEYCLIRDQGLVKGGRGLKHHETLIVFSVRGVAAKIVNSRKPKKIRGRDFLLRQRVAPPGHGLARDDFVFESRPGHKIAKTTPCKVKWAPARSTRAALRSGHAKKNGPSSRPSLISSRSRSAKFQTRKRP